MNTEKKIGHITSFFELQAQDIDENVVKFDQFKGQVTVVANVASYCGECSLTCYYCLLTFHGWCVDMLS